MDLMTRESLSGEMSVDRLGRYERGDSSKSREKWLQAMESTITNLDRVEEEHEPEKQSRHEEHPDKKEGDEPNHKDRKTLLDMVHRKITVRIP